MHKIFKLLNIICSQNNRIADIDRDRLPHELHNRIMRVLSTHRYLLDALENNTEDLSCVEHTLAYLDGEIEEICNTLPTIIHYRGITAEIFKGSNGYECRVTDRIGNILCWVLYTDSMRHAISKAECHFDGAIACLRGFTTTDEFFNRIYEYSI